MLHSTTGIRGLSPKCIGIASIGIIALLSAPTTAQLTGPLVIRGMDTNTVDSLGTSVDIDGGVIIAGAPGDAPNGDSSGSAYLFDASTGAQLFKLIPSDGAAQNIFGTSVSISGDRAIVGAPNANKAYVFDVQTGQQLRIIAGPGPFHFGTAVDLDGALAIIGSPADNNFQGAAYVYDIETGHQLYSFAGSSGSYGFAVSIRGDRAAVGAPFESHPGGRARLYDTGTGALVATLQSTGASEFGKDLDIRFGTLVVGAPTTSVDQSITGRVAVYDAQTGGLLAVTPGPYFADGTFVAANSSGFHAVGFLEDPQFPSAAVLTSYDPGLVADGSEILASPESSLAADAQYVVVGQPSDANNGLFAGAVSVFTDTRVVVLRIESQPADAIVPEGEDAAFSVVVTGGSPEYQWRRNGVPLSNGGNISGAQSGTLVIADVSGADVASYDCVVSAGGSDPLTSDPAVLAVIPAPIPCLADLNEDGILDLTDINLFVNGFTAGCP